MSTTAENEPEIHVFAEVVTENVDGKDDGAEAAETSSQSDSLNDAVGAAISGDTESEEGDGEGTYARTIVIGVDGSAQSYQAFHCEFIIMTTTHLGEA